MAGRRDSKLAKRARDEVGPAPAGPAELGPPLDAETGALPPRAAIKAAAGPEPPPPAPDGAIDGAVEYEPEFATKGGDGAGGDGPPPGAPVDPFKGCPVTPLGHEGLTYFMLSAAGQLVSVQANALKRNAIMGLFGGDLGWLIEHCPVYVSRSETPKKVAGAWSDERASRLLIGACTRRGVFDTAMPVRGAGVWCDPAAGGLIVHGGDRVLIGGAWRRAGFVHEGALYPAAPRLEKPAKEAAGTEVGQALLVDIARWEFVDETGADLVLGFIGQALLGAAPGWRVHLMVTAEYGAGKSWLAELVKAAIGAQAHGELTDYTTASLQQAFTDQARAIVLDEAENGEDGRVRQVIKLLRQLSGGGGARGKRGSPSGAWRGFNVNGCAYLTSIVPVPLEPQDLSRIVRVRLGRLPKGVEAAGQADEVMARIGATVKASPALRARAIEGFGRYIDSFQLYRAAVFAAGGDAREADTFGTLLAGRDLLLFDAVPDTDSIAETMAKFRSLIEAAVRRDEDESEGERCWGHLLTSAVGAWLGGDQQVVSQVLLDARSVGGSATAARHKLEGLGLRYEPADGRAKTPARLLVANNHQGLERVFGGSRWARGAWREALRYLPGTTAVGKTKRFAGFPTKSTAIPAKYLPLEEGYVEPEPIEEIG